MVVSLLRARCVTRIFGRTSRRHVHVHCTYYPTFRDATKLPAAAHKEKPQSGFRLSLEQYKHEPALFVQHSVVFYMIMTVAAAGLVDACACYWGWTENIEGRKLAPLLSKGAIVPLLRNQSPLGLVLLSIGAGVGEESLFRAFLQSALVDQGGYLLPDSAVHWAGWIGVAITTLLFGLIHNSSIVSIAASIILGVEYMHLGLPAAALSHALYDLIAMSLVAGLPQAADCMSPTQLGQATALHQPR